MKLNEENDLSSRNETLRTITSAPIVVAVANTGELIRHEDELFQIQREASYDFFRTMEIQSSAAAVPSLPYKKGERNR